MGVQFFCIPFFVMRAEDAPRTVGGRFRYRISLPYRRRLFFTPNASENAPRTTEACFLHRAHIPYPRRPSPVPNFPFVHTTNLLNLQKRISLTIFATSITKLSLLSGKLATTHLGNYIKVKLTIMKDFVVKERSCDVSFQSYGPLLSL